MLKMSEDLRSGRFLALLAISLIGYSSMIVLQAFNADDIIQGQPISGDTNTFLAQGRWGYYFVYHVLQDANPLGPFSLILGVILLAIGAAIGASTLQFRSRAASDLFVVLSTISLYYASVLSYDSTRIAYPLSTLMAIAGVSLVWRGKYLVAIALFAVSPAIYPASTQVTLTFASAVVLMSALRGIDLKRTLWKTATFVICLACGLGLYIALTKLSPWVSGIPLSGRSAIDPIGALSEYRRIVKLFLGHSIPTGHQMPYFNPAMKAFIWALMALFAITLILNSNKFKAPLIAASALGLILSPFALAFATPLDEFSPRALVAFSVVHALFAAVCVEFLPLKGFKTLANVSAVAAWGFIIFSAIQINGSAFDEYLSSRNDVLATNRIITRIDEVVANSDIPMGGPIPIAVRHEAPTNMSPRGAWGNARTTAWSKEWVFRQIDPRFAPVPPDVAETLLRAAPDTYWPQPNSVYVQDGVVVVIIN